MWTMSGSFTIRELYINNLITYSVLCILSLPFIKTLNKPPGSLSNLHQIFNQSRSSNLTYGILFPCSLSHQVLVLCTTNRPERIRGLRDLLRELLTYYGHLRFKLTYFF